MAHFSVTSRWSHWTGTLEDLRAAAVLAEERMREWTETESPVSVDLQMGEEDGRELSLDYLSELPLSRLGDVRHLSIAVGRYSGSRVTISARAGLNAFGLSITVEGDNRERVQGLFHVVKEKLQHGRRLGGLPFWAMTAGIWLCSLLINDVVGKLVSDAYYFAQHIKHRPEFGGGDVVGFVSGIIAVVLTWIAFILLFPSLELRPPNGLTRWQRFRLIPFTVVSGLVVAGLYDIVKRIWLGV